MKIVEWIARILLAVIFVFFGSNLMFHFLPNPPLPSGPIKDFTTVLFVTHYIVVVGFFQALGGILLFINRFVPLALAILAPVIVNILTTHLLVMHSGLFPVPILVVLLWIFLFWRHRAAFAGVFGVSAAA
jgi:putative oxidoreductase